LRAVLLCLVLAGLAGCAGRASEQSEKEVTLVVFAASSLTDAFEELGGKFEERNPGVSVRFSFAGSSTLLAQIRQGAPADVFAAADEEKMAAAVEEGRVSQPRVFARNLPVVVVPESDPAGVEGLRDLARPGVEVVLAQDGVPISEYAGEILRRAGDEYGGDFRRRVLENVVSREPDVRAAANRVALGEADATFVYVSDVTPGVRVIEVPEDFGVEATYPIAVLEEAPNPGMAREWVEFVLGEEGQRVLEEWGFRRTR
jgi:molybdate transport system substrate-binding protein